MQHFVLKASSFLIKEVQGVSIFFVLKVKLSKIFESKSTHLGIDTIILYVEVRKLGVKSILLQNTLKRTEGRQNHENMMMKKDLFPKVVFGIILNIVFGKFLTL